MKLKDSRPSSVSRFPSTGVRAILFDAGATLVHPDPPVEQIYAREFAADGARFSAEDFAQALARAWEQVHAESAADRYGGVRGEAAFWRRFLSGVRGILDGGVVSREVFERLATHFRDPVSWAVYEDVWPALDALEELGMPMAVVSNWDSHLPALLEGLGLRGRFRTVSVSAIEETGKPDAEIFRRTCERLGIQPQEALHVGDSLVEDYEGARAAGLRALLLDRHERHPGVADRIRTLAELPPLVQGPEGKISHLEP